MIRVYDSFGRLKEEIDTRTDYYLHISYVREHGLGWEEYDRLPAEAAAYQQEMKEESNGASHVTQTR